MMNRSTLFAVGTALAFASSVASAQPSLRTHHISAAGDAAVIVVAGSSGCAPPAAAAEQDGNDSQHARPRARRVRGSGALG